MDPKTLRSWQHDKNVNAGVRQIIGTAADEIERLSFETEAKTNELQIADHEIERATTRNAALEAAHVQMQASLDAAYADRATYNAWAEEVRVTVAWMRAENERLLTALRRIVSLDEKNVLKYAQVIATEAVNDYQQTLTQGECK